MLSAHQKQDGAAEPQGHLYRLPDQKPQQRMTVRLACHWLPVKQL